MSPMPEDTTPGKKNEKLSGPRILRDMDANGLGHPLMPRIREKLNEIEDILEDEYLQVGGEEAT